MTIQKVLIVDDSKTELMHLTGLLQKNGFSVKTAENAEDAFRRLAEEKPDLILMDVVMPGQNGFQLTRAISRDPLYKDVPIFMCTSKTQGLSEPPCQPVAGGTHNRRSCSLACRRGRGRQIPVSTQSRRRNFSMADGSGCSARPGLVPWRRQPARRRQRRR